MINKIQPNGKSMKLSLKISLYFLASLSLFDRSFSLTANQIKKICKDEKSYLICINNLEEKKSELRKGNLIEIPVIPYKK